MKYLLRFFFGSLLFVLLSCLTLRYPTHQAYALANFTTDYNVVYSVLNTTNTHATLHITLTNNTSNYYASTYKIQVGFNDIHNIVASDPLGAIKPTVTKQADGYSIALAFNKKSVGIGSQLPFTITFDTADVAHQFGNVWEIDIPGVSNPEDFTSFNVQVQVPPSFGTPTYIKPYQGSNSLHFSKEQLGKSGISIAFGSAQNYAYRLSYHLQNKNVFPVRTEIALPPSTNYQEVAIDSLDPQPTDVTVDGDGNWLAQYTLNPTQKIDVSVRGRVKIALEPQQESVSEKVLQQYLQSTQYWQTKDPKIRSLASTLTTPQAIYDYVVKTLSYDYTRPTTEQMRLGAVTVLSKPTAAVCLEFTDLFITLARAAGIPAREIDGFAYTENARQRPLSLGNDILHAWPEYYDRQTQRWIMVDPTWGNTTGGVDYFHTMDFDHFAFVLKGLNSEYPIPAGGYKLAEDQDKKDIDVTFTSVQINPEEQLSFSLPTNRFLPGLPISTHLLVQNIGSMATSAQQVHVISSSLTPTTPTVPLGMIPPFGHREIPIAFQATPFLTNAAMDFTIQLANQRIQQRIQITPFTKESVAGGIILALLTLTLFIITRKTRRL